MAGEWTKVRFGDLVKIVHGWPFKSASFSEERKGRPIVVSIGNFQYTGGFRFESTTVKEYIDEYPADYELVPRDVLLVMTCQTAGGEILGVPGRIPDDGNVYLHNQRMGKVVIQNSGRIDPDYIYHLARWSEFNRHLYVTASGSKILHTSPGRIEAFEFLLPPLREQKAIAAMLGALDDKIELNRRMNATLETMARALFQSWFVDFDPVHAKAEGRPPAGLDEPTAALFPAQFRDSELGEIPQGWAVKSIEEITERVAMGPFGSSIKVSTFVDEGIPVISGQHLHGMMLDDSEFNFVTVDHADKLHRANVQQGDVVFTHAGSIGQVALIPDTATFGRYILSQRQFYMRCDRRQMSPLFVVLYFKTPEGRHRLLANTSQTGVPSIAKPVTYLRQITLVVPPLAVLRRFEEVAGEWIKRIALNLRESRTLAALRDALLPKLLSGELSPHLPNPAS